MEKIWKTEDGRILEINKMETEHIKNCLNLLKRKNFISFESFNRYLNSYNCLGDAAQLCVDLEYANKIPNQTIDFFEEELKNRKELSKK